MRVRFIATIASLLLFGVVPATAQAHDHSGGELRAYAHGTWASFVAMTDERSGLPADILNSNGTTSVQTSTTNIGAYMWSAVVAERLGFISKRELVERLSRTIATLERMDRYEDTGQYYNWYDHRTGAKLTVWPPTGAPLNPILSSVDNGWLAVGLRIVENSVPQLRRRAGALYAAMDWGFYYRPEVNRVLFHFRPDKPDASPCCYDTVVSESRIVDYLGIARGQLPQKAYYGRWRTFPDTCDYSFQETKPIGRYHRYFGVQGVRGRLPVQRDAARSVVGRQHVRGADARTVRARGAVGAGQLGLESPADRAAQIHHGMTEAGYGYWGFSPANKPEGDYGVWGVDGGRHGSRTACRPTWTTRWSTAASRAARDAIRSPTRRRRPTRTASSRRTRRSSACATRPRRPCRTCAGWPATSRICTAAGASATA